MARSDVLIAQVAGREPRQKTEYALSDTKHRQRFGLVLVSIFLR